MWSRYKKYFYLDFFNYTKSDYVYNIPSCAKYFCFFLPLRIIKGFKVIDDNKSINNSIFVYNKKVKSGMVMIEAIVDIKIIFAACL